MKSPKSKSPEFAISLSEGFYQTGQSLAKHSHSDNATGFIWIAPGVVNFSFATELLLKAILMIDSNASIKGHKLFDLYKKIKPPTKQKIETIYNQKKSTKTNQLPAYRIVVVKDDSEDHKKDNNLKDIENILRLHSESFENWRYLYEFGEEGYSYTFDFNAMDNFYNSLKEVLLELLKNSPPKFAMKKA